MAPLTSAEKQKRYKERLKQNPEKYEEFKRKKREHYHANKRLVKNLTPKEKQNARVIWKLRKQTQRKQKKNLNRIIDMTPPSSPSLLQGNEFGSDDNTDASERDIPYKLDSPHSQIASPRHKVGTPTNNVRADSPQESGPSSKSRRCQSKPPSLDQQPGTQTPNNIRKRSKRKSKRNKKVFEENSRLKSENERLKQLYEKFKKRCARYKIKANKKLNEKEKYTKLSNAIKKNYKTLHKKKEKDIFKNLSKHIEGPGKETIIQEVLGLAGQVRIRSTPKNTNISQLKKDITDFFQRDDVSRATAGKKETVTKFNTKVQKRFLLDDMKHLYKTFKDENPGTKCSYYYFTKNKPFFIVKPSVDGREMCLCKAHYNPTCKATALRKVQAIKTDNVTHLIVSTVCDPNNKECMYGTCCKCRNKIVVHDVTKNAESVKYVEWQRQKESYEKNGAKMIKFKNLKIEKQSTVETLVREFNKEFKMLKKHIYIMKMQFKNFREAVDKLRKSEVVVVADFSENFNCKHHEEIQAHHFGGSRQQVSLHTVVAYVHSDENKYEVKSYCTICSSTYHQPAGIWAHLDPILKEIRHKYSEIETIHFYTDGPFCQYRQKQNFYLSATKLFDYGFNAFTWSYFEAGHGKGPADGIGGFLKRTADDIVGAGTDIACAEQFYEILKDRSKIKLYLIDPKAIEEIKKELPPKIAPLPGTINVHQIFTSIRGELKYRDIGCFCLRGFCDCHHPKIYKPIPPVKGLNIDKIKVDNPLIVSDDEKILSSDEDMPLSCLKTSDRLPLTEIVVPDLCQPRQKTIYDMVYGSTNSTDDDEPSPNVSVSIENTRDKSKLSRSDSDKDVISVQGNQVPSPTIEAHLQNDDGNPSTSKPTDIDVNQQSSSCGLYDENKENRGVRTGDYLVVFVHGEKGTMYKYVCLVNALDDDGDIFVTFMRSVKNRKTFKLDKTDMSYIDHNDIVKILPEPEVKTNRGQVYYLFKEFVDIHEK